jgi:hypothetical protein
MNMLPVLRKFGLVSALVSVLGACSGNPMRLGSPADERYDPTMSRKIEAEACGFQLFLFIPISNNNRAARAYRLLRERAGNDYITNVKVQESWYYALVGTTYCTALRADVYPLLQD